MTEPLRIGILGVAGISSKTALTIANPESNCEVRAVASRSQEKAENFIKEFFPAGSDVQGFGGPTGYDDLINSNNLIDGVYIPLPASIKKDWVIKALRKGLHVVLEKPAALNSADYEEMLQVAYANQKFLLDGTMFPHHTRTQKVLDCVADVSTVGRIDRVEANFTFIGDDAFQDDNIRARKDGDPHGCVGDLGWYCIRYALMVFGKLGAKVKSAQVVDFELTKHGVPQDATCVVRFEDNKVCWFHCGFKTAFRQRFEICGSKKSICIDDLVLPANGPASFMLSSSALTKYDLLTFHERDTVEVDAELVHEILLWKTFQRISSALDRAAGDFSGCTTKWGGDAEFTNEANEWASTSLTNQKVMDALIESLENGCVSVDIQI